MCLYMEKGLGLLHIRCSRSLCLNTYNMWVCQFPHSRFYANPLALLGAEGEGIAKTSDPHSQSPNIDKINGLRARKGRRFTTDWGPVGFKRADHLLSIIVIQMKMTWFSKWIFIILYFVLFSPTVSFSSLSLFVPSILSILLLLHILPILRWIQAKLTSWIIL